MTIRTTPCETHDWCCVDHDAGDISEHFSAPIQMHPDHPDELVFQVVDEGPDGPRACFQRDGRDTTQISLSEAERLMDRAAKVRRRFGVRPA